MGFKQLRKYTIMKTTKSVLLFSALSILFMSFTTVAKKWDFLGSRVVNFAIDKDEITVTAREGSFKRIKFQVRKAPVHFRKVIVHYRNGSREEVNLRDNIPAGGETRPIDLNGNNRIINKVTFYYNTKVRAKKKGKVKLLGWH